MARSLRSVLPALGFVIVAALYGMFFLGAESERAVAALLALAAIAIAIAARLGLADAIRRSIGANERAFDLAAVAGLLVAALWFREEHFIILMLTTAMLLTVVALGLTVQFGYAGIVNFAGSAFLGIGCYTAAVLTKYAAVPPLLILPLGGLIAALIGSIPILPVLPKRRHYAALVTIALGLLFETVID